MKSIDVCLCGDVMTGRGIDQILPYPVDPILYESCVFDAREYVRLAEGLHGPVPRAANFTYIWGEALEEFRKSDVRIINLETSVTVGGQPCRNKEVLYRMSPRNAECLTAARIDCCCLANNHILDWGFEGLSETLETLDKIGILHSGAGAGAIKAAAPAVRNLGKRGRLLVFGYGSLTSGIPLQWEATEHRPGVSLLRDLSASTAMRLASVVRLAKQQGDVAVVSIHWGGNWGYDISDEQRAFAHRLVDEGVDVVHGHSSHHAKALEVYRGHLILYGCGDFLTDYEGISGYETFRGDLAVLYVVSLDPWNGLVQALRLVPMQLRQFRLARAAGADAKWICDLLNDLSADFDTRFKLQPNNSMTLVRR